MKPLELTISAIDNFAEQTEISFERLESRGFFHQRRHRRRENYAL